MVTTDHLLLLFLLSVVNDPSWTSHGAVILSHRPRSRIIILVPSSRLPPQEPSEDDPAPITPIGPPRPAEMVLQQPQVTVGGRQVRFATASRLLQRVRLTSLMSYGGPTTAFLPSDQAFARLPPRQRQAMQNNPDHLRRVLLCHMAPSFLPPDRLANQSRVESSRGVPLLVTSFRRVILINGARVIATIPTTTGVIYIINRVIYPPPAANLTQLLAAKHPKLHELLQQTDLLSILDGPDNFTIFAPPEQALSQLNQTIMGNTTLLRDILMNHITPGIHFTRQMGPDYEMTSLANKPLIVSPPKEPGGPILVNDCPILMPDLSSGNGVIHQVGQIFPLEPSDIFARTFDGPNSRNPETTNTEETTTSSTLAEILTSTLSTLLRLDTKDVTNSVVTITDDIGTASAENIENSPETEATTLAVESTNEGTTTTGSDSTTSGNTDLSTATTNAYSTTTNTDTTKNGITDSNTGSTTDNTAITGTEPTIDSSSTTNTGTTGSDMPGSDSPSQTDTTAPNSGETKPATPGLTTSESTTSSDATTENSDTTPAYDGTTNSDSTTATSDTTPTSDSTTNSDSTTANSDTTPTSDSTTNSDSTTANSDTTPTSDSTTNSDSTTANSDTTPTSDSTISSDPTTATQRIDDTQPSTDSTKPSSDSTTNSDPASDSTTEETTTSNTDSTISNSEITTNMETTTANSDDSTGDTDSTTANTMSNPDTTESTTPISIEELLNPENFTIFRDWLNRTGLLDSVDTGKYTVAAPTDDAINQLPPTLRRTLEANPERLKDYVMFHLIPQDVVKEALKDGDLLPSASGDDIPVNVHSDGKTVTLAGARVVRANKGSPTVLELDRVMSPPPGHLYLTISKSPLLKTFTKLINAAGMEKELKDPSKKYTILAPTEFAYRSALSSRRPVRVRSLLKDAKAARAEVEKYIIPNIYYSSGIMDGTVLSTQDGRPHIVRVQPCVNANCMDVDNSPVMFSDIGATNGVVHTLEELL